MKRIRRPARRGVLLLVILGLLAMFGLVAMAFVVLTGQYKRGSLAASRAEQRIVSPEAETHQALLQLLRGSRVSISALNVNSLLEDVYGPALNDTTNHQENTSFRISQAATACGGQLIEVSIATRAGAAIAEPWWYVGRVLTVLEGQAKGLSTHIVGYNPANGKLQLRAFREAPVGALSGTVRCMINGAAFSGRGFGYDSVNSSGKPTDYALQPGEGTLSTDNRGGSNEDYDAPDAQNMFMAVAVPHMLAWPQAAGGPVPVPIPSFHRADLVTYWGTKAQWSDINFRRKVILRPLTDLHPNFNGSNPYFDPAWDGIYGHGAYGNNTCWDVDNDGDGIPDSIWLDLGLPVRSTPDGRRYKPLVAFLCLDLDGRLNLNVHGHMYQASSAYTTQYRGQANTASDAPGGSARFADGGGGLTQLQLPRGLGWGPAEISLLPLFEYPAGSQTNYQTGLYEKLLGGDGVVEGRYAEGAGMSHWPGASGVADPIAYNKNSTYPDSYYGGPRGYGSPPDIKGLMCVGLDLRGQPIYAMMGGLWAGSLTDQPYEMNVGPDAARGLAGPTALDNALSPAELSRILRAADVDAGLLPSRLARLTYYAALNNSILVPRRYEITTESWDIPVAPFAFNPANPEDTVRPRHVCEMAKLKFGMPAADSGATAALLRGKLLSWELLYGDKMNVNRPWGDGIDNNANGVIDEPAEAASETFPQRNVLGTDASLPAAQTDLTNGIDVNNDGAVNDTDKALARQLYARHLYCLALMLADLNYLDTTLGSPAATRRYLAQWAVNVVDFRDSDSIMTPFEYDTDPFTAGWRVDGRIGTTANPSADDSESYRGLVWGCERPELLFTEGGALHDRRTEDLEDFHKYNTTAKDKDPDFDQRYRPEGSLFLELYNPWGVREPLPAELYTGGGLRLDKTSVVGGDPVWRILIVLDAGQFAKDPDNPDPAQRPVVARTIYFVAPTANVKTGSGDSGNDATRFYPSRAISAIEPGRYVLIGPGEPDDTAKSITYLGAKDVAVDPADPTQGTHAVFDNTCRRIELNPGGSPQVFIFQPNDAVATPAGSVQAAVAAVINQPRRLNVTQPEAGYTEPVAADTHPPELSPILDHPLDTETRLKETGTYTNFCVVHLQRLADPLKAFDKDANPYRTVDSMGVDLHTFNGTFQPDLAVDPPVQEPPGWEDDEDKLKFASWERGEEARRQYPDARVNALWLQEPLTGVHVPQTTPDPGQAADATFLLKKNLLHTLAYLNRTYGTPRDAASGAGYAGDPQYPFPWLSWPNRPFVNQYELMLVPAQKQSELLKTFRVVTAGAAPNPYQPTGTADVPFPHLLNFCQTGKTPTPSGTHSAPLLYRLMDYVHVPSPFVGTEVQVPAAQAAASTGHFFRPPFNRIPLFREPGRMNVNTITSPSVAEGLVNFFPGLWDMAMWNRFVGSRKGAAIVGADAQTIATQMLTHNSALPSRFGQPFRAWYGSYLVPTSVGTERDEIEATLLRSYTEGSARRPLLENRSTQFATNADQNPYFRYQAYQKLGNLLTTRSNVYAVWITVGYFEVTPHAPDFAQLNYLDGFELGRELGVDTGEVKRHRAFYIIDRTIPVAFERGQDHNVEKTILLRQFIE